MNKLFRSERYEALCRTALRLGGHIVMVNGQESLGFLGNRGSSGAPFSRDLAIYWKKKIIVHTPQITNLAGLIHEMGHVFACKYPPGSDRCNEVDFLGWEYSLATTLGCKSDWIRDMKDYLVDGDTEGLYPSDCFGNLTNKQRASLLAVKVALAQAAGSLTKDGRVRSIRGSR